MRSLPPFSTRNMLFRNSKKIREAVPLNSLAVHTCLLCGSSLSLPAQPAPWSPQSQEAWNERAGGAESVKEQLNGGRRGLVLFQVLAFSLEECSKHRHVACDTA